MASPKAATTLWDWNIDDSFGFVALPTHTMFLRATGPPRDPAAPAIIIEAGLGHSSAYWTAVMRLISPFARVYSYDRSGQGDSETSPLPRTAQNMAQELKLLLETTGIKPPYVLVAHSFGCVIARELLELEGEGVQGMVLVEARTELSDAARPDGLEECLHAMFENVDFGAVLNSEGRQRMSAFEWRELNAEPSEEEAKKRGAATTGELESYKDSCAKLAEKRQFERQVLGSRPVSVVKGDNAADMRRLFNAGVEKRNGLLEQRKLVEGWLADPEKEVELQRAQLGLSRRGRLVFASHSGHDVQLTEPELIAEEVKWILGILEVDKLSTQS